MPHSESIEGVINAAVDRVVQRFLPVMQRALAEVEAGAVARARSTSKRPASPRRRRTRAGEMTRWVADNRARRVPIFVIEATGLDTKKKIVARFGANVTFEKGKPLPPELAQGKGLKVANGPSAAAARVVRAKAPGIRKAAVH
jgi:hypothetical protein